MAGCCQAYTRFHRKALFRHANVKQLVIGHFSARYEDESVLLHEASAIFPQTILAKENLCIDVDGGTVYEK